MPAKKKSVKTKKSKAKIVKGVRRVTHSLVGRKISVVMRKSGELKAMESLRQVARVFTGGSVAELVRRIVMDVVDQGNFDKPGYIDRLFPRQLDAFLPQKETRIGFEPGESGAF